MSASTQTAAEIKRRFFFTAGVQQTYISTNGGGYEGHYSRQFQPGVSGDVATHRSRQIRRVVNLSNVRKAHIAVFR